MGPLELLRLRHTSRVGGASDTEHTAVAVKPALPPGPSVVTTWTAAPSCDMPLRNVIGSTVVTDSGAIASNAPTAMQSGGWSVQVIANPVHAPAYTIPGCGSPGAG